MIVQIVYGLYILSLGLISAAFHTGFDIAALLVVLAATIVARRPAKFPFAYGYDRFEVLAGFTNSIFLIFVALFMIIESFHRWYMPPEIHSDDLYLASLALLIDVVGLAVFHNYHTLRIVPELVSQHQAPQKGDRGHDANFHGVFLHVKADAYVQMGLMLAEWLVQWKGWSTSHAFTGFIVAYLIVRSVYPLFHHTGMILLQTTSPSIQHGLDRCLREISFYDGVLEYRNAHWWTQSPSVTIGSLHLRLRADADEQATLAYVHSLLRKYLTHVTVQIQKDQPVPALWGAPM